jgi:hypothetical protein
LNRWLPLVKWLLAIPHYVVLFFLGIAAVVAVIITWFAILFTGLYPRALFNFVEGVTGGGAEVELDGREGSEFRKDSKPLNLTLPGSLAGCRVA